MLASAAASSSPVALWFLTRGTGVVTLLLFTLTVILGIANRERLQTSRIPRFVVDGIHRNASLLAVVFLCVHIGTTLADSYVPITIANVLIPFSSSYKPFWVGLGAISFDLLMAVALTSALRRYVGHRVWRGVHWLAYAAWPVALVHGIGMGSDRHSHWMLGLTGACVLAVAIALLIRLRERAGVLPKPRVAVFPS